MNDNEHRYKINFVDIDLMFMSDFIRIDTSLAPNNITELLKFIKKYGKGAYMITGLINGYYINEFALEEKIPIYYLWDFTNKKNIKKCYEIYKRIKDCL